MKNSGSYTIPGSTRPVQLEYARTSKLVAEWQQRGPESLSGYALEAPAYVALQREMHDALLRQHPEWIERDGDCPTCDDYDRRFAELLGLSLAFNRGGAR